MTTINVTPTDGEYLVHALGQPSQARVHYDARLDGWAIRWTGQPEAWLRVRVCGTKQGALGLAMLQLLGEEDE